MIQLTNYSLQVELERRGRSRKWAKEEQQGTFIGVYFGKYPSYRGVCQSKRQLTKLTVYGVIHREISLEGHLYCTHTSPI